MEINGKKVVDATRKTAIHITKRDTTEGDNKNPSGCAAARAAKRDVPNCISARVHIGRVYIEYRDKWVRYFTPDRLRTEIIAFDRGGSFQPGDYTLLPPSAGETSEARQEYRSNKNRNRPGNLATKSPRRVHVATIKHHAVSGIRPRGAVR